MKSVVLDTNILLDVFVFNDERAADLKTSILHGDIEVIASQKTLTELADVISRPLFDLDTTAQDFILHQWRTLAKLQDDSDLGSAPWKCQDSDDQIFLDLAYAFRPAVLISKDKALLRLATKAAKDGIVITANYNAFKPQT